MCDLEVYMDINDVEIGCVHGLLGEFLYWVERSLWYPSKRKWELNQRPPHDIKWIGLLH